jgi:hypothetical protein
MDGRKKPGRPRKYPLKKNAQRNGVGNVVNAANMVELVYDSIASFKSIFLLFKSMAAKDLCMEFKPNALHIYATDHLNKSNARVIIDCQKANHYYCAEPHKIFLEPTSIEKIIQTLDKMHNFINIIVKAADRNTITFIFKNDLKIDECHEISTIQLGSELPVANFDPVAYPIRFSMPSKYLKKFINDSSCFSDSINICKVGGEPLVFGYTSRDRIVKSRRIVTSGEMVDLVSTVADGDIFSVSILLEHVKPISTIMISEKITIFADIRQNLILSMRSDDGSMAIDTSISIVAI